MNSKITLACMIMLLMTMGAEASVEYYVSPSGNDSNAGTEDKPFATLEGARVSIRQERDKGSEDKAIVWIDSGVYQFHNTFELDERDSNITFKSKVGQRVFLTGGIEIEAGFVEKVSDAAVLDRIIDEQAREKVYQLDLFEHGVKDFGKIGPRGFRRPYVTAPLEIFINGEPLRVACYPNGGRTELSIGKVYDGGPVTRWGAKPDRGAIFQYVDDRISLWKDADDLWISGFFANGYADNTVKVKVIDVEKKTMTTEQPHMYGFHSTGKYNYRKFYAMNLIEELDEAGEYYVDKIAGRLYFIKPDGCVDLNKARIQISLLDEPMVALEGCDSVCFENLTFECSRGIGVYIERGRGNKLLGCTIRNIGIVAVCIGKGVSHDKDYRHAFTGEAVSRELGSWHEHIYDNTAFNRQGGSDHKILSCDIYNIGAGGISLGGGDRRTLTKANNQVVNCHIHHVNRWGRTFKAAVNIDGVGNKIRHCDIHHCTGNAIYLHGNDHIIEYNKIHHSMLEGEEMGVFYMGRDPGEYGNIFRCNFMYQNGNDRVGGHGCFALHLDDNACGLEVVSNVIYDSGHETGVNGGYHTFVNNIFIDNKNSVSRHAGIRAGRNPEVFYKWTRESLGQKRLIKDVNITREPYSTRYPQLLKLYSDPPESRRCSKVWNNVSVRSGTLCSPRPEENPQGHDMKNNYVTDKDPGFVDASNLNFQLRDGSVIYKKVPGFKRIPFEKIGLYLDSYRTSASRN